MVGLNGIAAVACTQGIGVQLMHPTISNSVMVYDDIVDI